MHNFSLGPIPEKLVSFEKLRSNGTEEARPGGYFEFFFLNSTKICVLSNLSEIIRVEACSGRELQISAVPLRLSSMVLHYPSSTQSHHATEVEFKRK